MGTKSMVDSLRSLSVGSTFLIAAIAVVGCGGGSTTAPAPSTPPVVNTDYAVKADAGTDVKRADASSIKRVVLATAMKYGASRPDPFALTDAEKKYDAAQSTERILASSGGWRFDYVEPEDKEASAVFEPQPQRRLMGVIVGDAVYAVIDMGDGRGQIIYPGFKIPNSEWYVVSIDEDKAILRRDSVNQPKEVTVKLQGASAFGGNQNTNAPAGGFPGPGGRRGGNMAPGGDDVGF